MMPTPHKLNAAETALGGALPHRRDEAWKWTDVRASADTASTGLTQAVEPSFVPPKGLSVTRTTNTVSDQPMAGLASRFGGETYAINVPAGFSADERLEISIPSGGHARIVIKIGKGAALNMHERYDGAERLFSNIDINIELAQGAKLTRTVFQKDDSASTRIVTANISAWAKTEISQHVLSFGGALTRLETRIAVMGANVKAAVNGAYLLAGERHSDFTSYIDLGAPDALIRQTVKGVAADQARGVFQGKFHVRRPAQHTDAEMRHDALMVSENAEIRAKPELEIYADDVACAHGNTLGALDESALFYMRQRGIPIAQARALLTEAFVAEAFDDLDEGSREALMSDIRTWLEQVNAA